MFVDNQPCSNPLKYSFYFQVAKLVEKMCERDAANGVEIAQQLVGKVSRKVVKQTVMTLVYGVTFIGGRRQISGQLDELGLSPSVVWQGSSYLTRNVFASIREMFHAAKDIQVRTSRLQVCIYNMADRRTTGPRNALSLAVAKQDRSVKSQRKKQQKE